VGLSLPSCTRLAEGVIVSISTGSTDVISHAEQGAYLLGSSDVEV
jgi:hypothetical protein